MEIGLIYNASGQNINEFRAYVEKRVATIQVTTDIETFLTRKRAQRLREESKKSLNDYRNTELRKMWANFNNPESQYHSLRYRFVHKIEGSKQLHNYSMDNPKIVLR